MPVSIRWLFYERKLFSVVWTFKQDAQNVWVSKAEHFNWPLKSRREIHRLIYHQQQSFPETRQRHPLKLTILIPKVYQTITLPMLPNNLLEYWIRHSSEATLGILLSKNADITASSWIFEPVMFLVTNIEWWTCLECKLFLWLFSLLIVTSVYQYEYEERTSSNIHEQNCFSIWVPILDGSYQCLWYSWVW